MDVMGFADPWEHLRLLADVERNRALHALLRRRAPGARVLEVGTGTGVFACLAARLGASRVVAVEPTPLAAVARELVAANGLGDRVQVIEALLEDVPPEPMDLVFAELLNADPFLEDAVGVARTARRWLAPGGHLAPHTLEIWAAPLADPGTTDEVRAALDQLADLDLDVGPVVRALSHPEPYRYVGTPAAGPGVRVQTVRLGEDDAPDTWEATVPADGTVHGAVVWFVAHLDHGLVLANRPGTPNHWGQLVCAWPTPVTAEGALRLRFAHDEDGLEVTPAG